MRTRHLYFALIFGLLWSCDDSEITFTDSFPFQLQVIEEELDTILVLNYQNEFAVLEEKIMLRSDHHTTDQKFYFKPKAFTNGFEHSALYGSAASREADGIGNIFYFNDQLVEDSIEITPNETHSIRYMPATQSQYADWEIEYLVTNNRGHTSRVIDSHHVISIKTKKWGDKVRGSCLNGCDYDWHFDVHIDGRNTLFQKYDRIRVDQRELSVAYFNGGVLNLNTWVTVGYQGDKEPSSSYDANNRKITLIFYNSEDNSIPELEIPITFTHSGNL